MAGNPGFHPTVGVGGAHHLPSGDGIERAAGKTRYYPGRYAHHAQHHRHGGGEILAVSLLPVEQKVGQRIGYRRGGQLQRIAVMCPQISLHGRGLLSVLGLAGGDLPGQGGDSRIQVGGEKQQFVAFERRQRVGRSPRSGGFLFYPA